MTTKNNAAPDHGGNHAEGQKHSKSRLSITDSAQLCDDIACAVADCWPEHGLKYWFGSFYVRRPIGNDWRYIEFTDRALKPFIYREFVANGVTPSPKNFTVVLLHISALPGVLCFDHPYIEWEGRQ